MTYLYDMFDCIHLFASTDIFEQHQDSTGSTASSSFGKNSRKEDFGRSVWLKEIEKGVQDVPEDQQWVIPIPLVDTCLLVLIFNIK